MTECSSWLEELTHTADVVLDEDLAALEKMPAESRVCRYNDIKSNEDELLWDFSKECSDFLTDSERDHLRGRLRLARLLLAASFYDDGTLPEALEGDFIDAELQAVVEFDAYKQFDVLSEAQIEERIRRMEGEVYELVTEYTSTQIANMDELVDNPDVQQDVIEKLVDRYDERREKIRQGFFVYVETHGLEHMVEAIEDAVTAVSNAADEREQVRAEMQQELDALSTELETRFQHQKRELESTVRQLEQQLARGELDEESFSAELADVREQRAAMSETQTEAVEKLETQIEQTTGFETRLERQITELEDVKEQTATADREAARNEATELVEEELANLQAEYSTLETEIEQLEREQEQIEQSTLLDADDDAFDARLETLEQSIDADTEAGIKGEQIVTATIARLLELDYLGRFETAMHNRDTLQTPDGSFDVPEGYWEGRSSRSNEQPRLNGQLLAGEDPAEYPSNQAARYEMRDSGYLGLTSETTMVIEALVYTHLEAFATNGFDTQPADIDDLLGLVNDAVSEAEDGEYTYLLGIASPTGWTDRVRQQVTAPEMARTRYSRHVSICLIDLQTGDVIYDESDPLLSDNLALFEPAIDTERTSDCLTVIREEYVADAACDSVLLSELIEDHGFDSHIIKRAFNRLEDDDVGEQLYVEDVGLALYLE